MKNKVTLEMIINDEVKRFSYTKGKKPLRVLVDIGQKDSIGRIKYKEITGKNELALRRNILKYYESEAQTPQHKQTVKVGIENWMLSSKYGKIKNSSYDEMEDTVKHYIFPHIGDIRICDLKERDCSRLIDNLTINGYSYSVIRRTYAYLNGFFNYLLKEKILRENLMSDISLPSKERIDEIRERMGKLKRDDKKMYFTREQVRKIQDVIYNGYYSESVSRSGNTYKSKEKIFISQAPVFDLLLQTGLRVSELCGLKYSDWNEETNTLHICRNRKATYERDIQTHKRIGSKKVAYDGSPKTKESKSKIKISDYANDIIKNLHDSEPEGYNDYIVHNKDGKPMTRNELRGRWHRLLCAAGIEHKETVIDANGKKRTKIVEKYGIHMTRHTFASLMYATVPDIELVSKQLRHCDSAITSKIYVDVIEENAENLVKNLRI